MKKQTQILCPLKSLSSWASAQNIFILSISTELMVGSQAHAAVPMPAGDKRALAPSA